MARMLNITIYNKIETVRIYSVSIVVMPKLNSSKYDITHCNHVPF